MGLLLGARFGRAFDSGDVHHRERRVFALGPNAQQFPDATPTTPFGPSSWSGVWFRVGAGGGWLPSGSDDRIFLGQVTLRPGAVLSTEGVFVNVRDFHVSNPVGVLGAVQFGIANASNNAGRWGYNYYLSEELIPTTLGGGFTGWVTHAIYLNSIPAPGVATTMLMSAIVVSRRPRRTL